MPNLFLNLPVPSTSGAGAAVDVSKMGATKTLIVGGSVSGAVTLEYSTDATGVTWAPIPNGSFSNPGRVTIDVVAHWMRAVTTGSASANADVGAPLSPASFVQIGAAPVDISALPPFKTVVAPGKCNVEISEDGTSWSQVFSFPQAGGQSGIAVGMLARCLTGVVWMGGAEQGAGDAEDGWPVYPVTTIITDIVANSTGSDATGSGTATNPYRTFQRAIRDVPHIIPPNNVYNVILTETTTPDVEVLPDNYQMPEIHTAAPLVDASSTAFLPFRQQTPLNIKATPLPKQGFTLADMTIVATDILSITDDPDTGLTTITLVAPRAAWGVDLLKGAVLNTSYHNRSNNPVTGNTTSTLRLANGGGSFVAPVGAETIVVSEQSKVLQANATKLPFFAITCEALGGMAWQGIGFTDAAGGTAMYAVSTDHVAFEMCNIQGLFSCCGTSFVPAVENTVIRDGVFALRGTCPQIQRTFFWNVNFVDIVASNPSFLRTVWDGTTFPIRNGDSPGGGGWYGAGNNNVDFFFTLITGSNGPDVDFWGGAVVPRPGGAWSFAFTQINNCSADGLNAQGLVSVMIETMTGSGNAGHGIAAQDGASIRLGDDFTTITGALGDMKVGQLPARTWLDFKTLAPIKNQYDLTTPFELNVASGLSTPPGDALTTDDLGGRSGSRVFQRIIV